MEEHFNPFTIDFETTGKDAAAAYAIEAALASPDDGAYELQTFIALPPAESIPPETSAVHHIIDEDIVGAPDWATVVDMLRGAVELDESLEGVVLAAHNAEYEQAVLAGTWADKVMWVCTYKCALVAWPDAPSHSNEGLRYWLKIGTRGRNGPKDSHSALHDAKVTAGIFNALVGYFGAQLAPDLEVNSEAFRAIAIRHMIEVSKQPAELPTCPIGKERGKKWADIDAGFLSWCLRQADMREDVKYACQKELDRRYRAPAAPDSPMHVPV